uniref:DUF72 domain-containing protein n=1 Tax=uncultured Armatimonadetes bacterium TaxID=157466 RepID=A0A6J4JXE8_9BACT|nr:FIG003003: hypothetical protein [uncultured Armatimonadetes bacterium]
MGVTRGAERGGVYVGCAGWSIPKEHAAAFPGTATGTHLERYARQLPAVEINSSFYRPHRPATYQRWAESVPDPFRFSVKVPRQITHLRRLADSSEPLDAFLAEVAPLGAKLGPLLVQLPPGLPFDPVIAPAFLAALRERFPGSVVCEPRHPGWFVPEVERVLAEFRVARAAADPAPVPEAAHPGGWEGLVYHRLHGSPRIYHSEYAAAYLENLATKLAASAAAGVATWCIFDNTALGAATANALFVMERLSAPASLTGADHDPTT